MDNDISHATQAALDDHEERLAAIEEHLGLADGDDDDGEDGEDGDGEDNE